MYAPESCQLLPAQELFVKVNPAPVAAIRYVRKRSTLGHAMALDARFLHSSDIHASCMELRVELYVRT